VIDQTYPQLDAVGSPYVLTNEFGVVTEQRTYNVFGASSSSLAGSPLKAGFTGHEHDPEEGLINMRGRIYDPSLRRFLQADPIVAYPLDTQGLNRYSYVMNDPATFTDPTGYCIDLSGETACAD